jgi:hypothetical protein
MFTIIQFLRLADVKLDDELALPKFQEKAWRKALSNFALGNVDLKEKDIQPKNLCSEARQYLMNKLDPDLSNLEELVLELIQGIQDELLNPIFRRFNSNRKPRADKLPLPIVQRELDQQGHRKREKWSQEEDKILIEGYQKFADCKQVWGKICVQLLKRSNMDCKSRWKNLLKKHHTLEAIYGLLQVVENQENEDVSNLEELN